jgi:tRNA (guanine-N1)-methyltransferase
MRFDILTIFPELFAPHLTHGVTRRAFESRQVDVRLWPLRDFADDNYRRVDDRPYGGGPGMVMLAEPLERAPVGVKWTTAGASTRRVCSNWPPGPAPSCCAAATRASTSGCWTAM